MTDDPNRSQNPGGLNPRPETNRDQSKKGMKPGIWIAIVAVLAVATMLMFNMRHTDNKPAFGERPVTNSPVTTGAGATDPAPAIRDRATGANPPAANEPAPSTPR